MDKSLIIKELINIYGNGKNAEFAKILGVKPQTINTWMARNTFDIELIFAKCENIDANWLLTGEGPMLRDERPCSEASPADRDEIISLLREKIADKERIIALLEEKIEAMAMGGNSTAGSGAATA